jgi:hypothetical protein
MSLHFYYSIYLITITESFLSASLNSARTDFQIFFDFTTYEIRYNLTVPHSTPHNTLLSFPLITPHLPIFYPPPFLPNFFLSFPHLTPLLPPPFPPPLLSTSSPFHLFSFPPLLLSTSFPFHFLSFPLPLASIRALEMLQEAYRENKAAFQSHSNNPHNVHTAPYRQTQTAAGNTSVKEVINVSRQTRSCTHTLPHSRTC